MSLALGILDQSPIISGTRPADAVAETVRLAEVADRLGFARYWLAEHHAIAALGDPCPEILTARVAAATSRIRVGTGGVLLPYYSALKVAEQFRMLEALFPGRIDLGLGRAPGGDRLTAQAVARGPYAFADDFPEQVRDLVGFLDGNLPPEPSLRAGEGAAGRRDLAGGVAARLLGLQRRPRGGARPAVRVRALHQRPWRRRGDAGLPGDVQAVGARIRPAGDRLRVRDLRGDRSGGRAARRVDRSPPAAHGARGRFAGADGRGGGSAPLHRAGARLRRLATRPPGARRAGRGARRSSSPSPSGSARTS